MPLSTAALKRREYPEVDTRTKEKLSDAFFFVYKNDSGEIQYHVLKYMRPMTRPTAQDILRVEDEIGCKPLDVLKGLYFEWDTKNNIWVETEKSKRDPTVFESIKDLYYSKYRPEAYKADGRDDLYGANAPASPSDHELYVQKLEKKLRLMQDKERIVAEGKLKLTNTTTGEIEGNSKAPEGVSFKAGGE